jgi:predicted metal-dependent hydrolase
MASQAPCGRALDGKPSELAFGVRTLTCYHPDSFVQLDLPFLRTPPDGSVREAVFPTGVLERPERSAPPVSRMPDPPAVDFVRMRRARRYVLRVRPDGSVRVTVPRGGSRAEANRFLEKHAAWIQRERSRLRSSLGAIQWTDGSTLLLRGERVTVRVGRAGKEEWARCGDRSVRIPAGAVDLRPFIEADLRALARQELPPRLAELASVHGLTVTGVSIRNQKSRWGSCSPGGRIALNFRLVQMPREVSDYVLVHELMHLEQQNHSRSFWRLVEAACPGFRAAERWLKTEGKGLF